MLAIDRVKVSPLKVSLAHVSHFFPETEPWAYTQSTHFAGRWASAVGGKDRRAIARERVARDVVYLAEHRLLEIPGRIPGSAFQIPFSFGAPPHIFNSFI